MLSRLRSFPQPPAAARSSRLSRERRKASLAAACVLALFGLLTLDAPQGRARAGLFDEIFGSGYSSDDYGYSRRGWGDYGSRHAHKSRYGAQARQKQQAPAAQAGFSTPASRRTVCVRACDGYSFGVLGADGGFDSASRQAACNAACPDAETKLFVMQPGAEDASKATDAHKGESYSQFLASFKSRENKPASCGCHVASTPASAAKALLSDPTLRYGDLIVTTKGVQVYRGASNVVQHKTNEFLSLAETHAIAPAHRGALAAIDKMLKLRPAPAPAEPERRLQDEDAGK
jgi:hypothetical protein